MNKKETTKTTETTFANVETYDISNSAHTMALANDVARFIKENKLTTLVQAKEHVSIEAWLYAGSRLGIFPVVQECNALNREGEIIYEAKVNLLNTRTGQIVGAGVSVCSNKENGKKYNQEFAISSMAQTRATGKAFRNMLGWVIKAAGFEATPAEEMDYGDNNEPAKKAPVQNIAKPEMKAERTVLPDSQEFPNEAPEPEAEAPQIDYATSKQKEEIIRLLNHTLITRQEKTTMLLNINKLTKEKAETAMAKMKAAIQERTQQTENA